MKILIVLTLAVLGFAASCGAATNTVFYSITSRIGGKEMAAKVTRADIDRTPPWPDCYGNPPLELKDAIRKAKEYAETFREDTLKVELGDILAHHGLMIMQVGKIELLGFGERYIYVIQVFIREEGKLDGFILPLNIVVLMDGTVVKLAPVNSAKPAGT